MAGRSEIRTNWTITASDGDRTLDSAKDAAAFIKANMGRGEHFEVNAPTQLSALDLRYFEAQHMETTFNLGSVDYL
ncbi:hypothetical protein [Rhizobium sp. BK376]|uniref:hypothetical protein n=1 Tax=Rhizobium sp. BK376 TaxID=2512149 RepID=UPI0010510941|nr:hypothetical protein [Rhizobium sp. BK376]TCR67904.1 hypothetical protein EV561_1461 [Rhizobium sp. BK376]